MKITLQQKRRCVIVWEKISGEKTKENQWNEQAIECLGRLLWSIRYASGVIEMCLNFPIELKKGKLTIKGLRWIVESLYKTLTTDPAKTKIIYKIVKQNLMNTIGMELRNHLRISRFMR